jgi:hypothetical protein
VIGEPESSVVIAASAGSAIDEPGVVIVQV